MQDTADREEILRLLSAAARKGNVPAMRLLLEESRRDGDDPQGSGIIDELAGKRKKASNI